MNLILTPPPLFFYYFFWDYVNLSCTYLVLFLYLSRTLPITIFLFCLSVRVRRKLIHNTYTHTLGVSQITHEPNTHKHKTKACPECKNTYFLNDSIHAETVCAKCGLVVEAPPCYGLVFPGYVVLYSH